MVTLSAAPSRTAFVDGTSYLFCSGYSYLSMGDVPAFKQLVQEGMDRYGILYPSSRISNTRLDVFATMESLLSNITHQQETVLFSSGFLAGRAVVDALANNPAYILMAPGTHPAIQARGIRLEDNWQQQAVDIINESKDEQFTIFSDAVNPLSATVTDYSFLQQVAVTKQVVCVIDDSHGIGLLGQNGEGITNSLPDLPNVSYVISYSLSKALHINGGAVSCSSAIASKIRQSTCYTASTPLSPSLAHAFINAQPLYTDQLNKLKQNIAYTIEQIEQTDVQFHPLLPMFILPKALTADLFYQHNIIISSFGYPDPGTNISNRIVVSAGHLQEDIDTVVKVLKQLQQLNQSLC